MVNYSHPSFLKTKQFEVCSVYSVYLVYLVCLVYLVEKKDGMSDKGERIEAERNSLLRLSGLSGINDLKKPGRGEMSEA